MNWSADAGGPAMVESGMVSSEEPGQVYIGGMYDKDCTVYALVVLTSNPAPANASILTNQASKTIIAPANGYYGDVINPPSGSIYNGDYTIYIVAVGTDGKLSAITTLTFSVDAIPPVATLFTADAITATGATIGIRYNEACFRVNLLPLLATEMAPTSTYDFYLNESSGKTIILLNIPAQTTTNVTLFGLSPSTAYKVYAYGRDLGNNESDITNISFTTLTP